MGVHHLAIENTKYYIAQSPAILLEMTFVELHSMQLRSYGYVVFDYI